MDHDGYYAEISISIDGWPWNLADRATPTGRVRNDFPLAAILLRAWEKDEVEQRRRVAQWNALYSTCNLF